MPRLDLSHCLLLACLAAPVSGQVAGRAGSTLATAADADRSGDVTAAEWRAFVESLKAGEGGALDKANLRARLLLPVADRNRDGKLSAADMDQIFADLDGDANGTLSAAELTGAGGGRRRAGFGNRGFVSRLIAEKADANGDEAVDAAEWRAHKTKAGDDDAVSLGTLAEWLVPGEAKEGLAPGAFTPSVFILTLESGLDADRDGSITVADLRTLFAGLDADKNGALAQTEMRARGGRGQGRGAGRGRVIAADRSRPPLMPWQRNLDDALELVRRTGKPLLICVNVDDEPDSERLAWQFYRDPEFARLADGFICVIASPDRHGDRDHDARGRRLADPRFGRVTSDEHVSIEPTLFEKYFNKNRVAPRHVGIDKDGRRLFDIFLAGLGPVEAALRKHGKRDARATATGAKDRRTLLDSPDASDRSQLEKMFAEAGAKQRAALAEAALSKSRRTQHPEILRLALLDVDRGVRAAGARAAAAHIAAVPTDLLVPAFRAAHADAGVFRELAAAIARPDAGPEARAKQIARLRKTVAALARASEAIDVGRWIESLRADPGRPETPPSADERGALDERLTQLEAQAKRKPEDRGVRLQIAAATMRYARAELARGKDPSFLLQDVVGFAKRATTDAAPNGKALGYVAWASYMLSDFDGAAEYATRALPLLTEAANTPLAAHVLDSLARVRTREIYAALQNGGELQDSWVPDACAAFDVLAAHAAWTESQANAHLDLLGNLDAFGRQADVARAAVQRFPASAKLHEYLRFVALRDGGGAGLAAVYAELEVAADARPTADWFAGLANLFAAERLAKDAELEDAVKAYERCTARYARSVAANPAFADSANHYVCLAHAGRARLLGDAERWAAAAAAIKASYAARRTSVNSKDGLENTPRDTANRLIQAMSRAGDEAGATALRQALDGS